MVPQKILLIEDELGIRMTLEDRLKAEGYEIETCATGLEGEEMAKRGSFDLLLLDIMLPDRDGLAICKNLRAGGFDRPIIMLTARNTNLDVVIGLRQGADDYLAKPFDTGVLLARIEAALRRAPPKTPVPEENPDCLSFGTFLLDTRRGELKRLGQDGEAETLHLNAQEYRLLEYLAARPGVLLDREEILNRVWGYESEITTRTVDVHVAKLRQHLGESEFPRHIRTVRGLGYKFVP